MEREDTSCRPLVIKFGGTSVGSGARFVRAARIVAEAAQRRPVAVVVSAMSGVTDTLLDFADATAGSREQPSTGGLRRALADRHLAAVRESVSGELQPGVEERLLCLLEELLGTIGSPGADQQGRRAEIAVYGERLSAEILAVAITSLGAQAAVAADPIATDSNFAEGEVKPEKTRERCNRRVAPILEEGAVAVTPGFVGRSPEGLPTTLGRGGSDLSATVLGRALGSSEVWIMSDVAGVLDADPRLVPEAALMRRLSYGEAALFASLGAKVLHPRTMEPAQEAGIEVYVRNTFDPGVPGTRITARESGPGLRCAALRRKLPAEIPCSRERSGRVASVVCIGIPQNGDVEHGVRALREAGVGPIHAGIAAAGPVFYVADEAAEEALRALHAALILPRTLAAGTDSSLSAEEVA